MRLGPYWWQDLTSHSSGGRELKVLEGWVQGELSAWSPAGIFLPGLQVAGVRALWGLPKDTDFIPRVPPHDVITSQYQNRGVRISTSTFRWDSNVQTQAEEPIGID